MTRKLFRAESSSTLRKPRRRQRRSGFFRRFRSQPGRDRSPKLPVQDESVIAIPLDHKDLSFQKSPQKSSPSRKASPPRKAKQSAPRKSLSWLWFWAGTLSFLAGTSSAAFLLLARVPPSPDCQNLSPLAAPAEQLYCAQQLAQSGQAEALLAAIAVAKQIAPTHPLYGEAQKLLGESSEEVLALATQQMRQGDLSGAISMVKAIPQNSPLYQQGQAAIADWTKYWNRGQKLYDTAQAAISVQNWQQATEQVRALGQVNNPHWKGQVGKLTRQIQTEKLAWQKLRQAQKLAQANTVSALSQAIALVQQIEIKRDARAEAQSEIARWGRELLNLAAALTDQKDFQGAIAAAKHVPANSALFVEAQDLMQLSRAQAAAVAKGPLALLEAQAIARTIGTDRPLYRPAQKLIDRWQAEWRDRSQLQFAKVTASLGQKFSYQLAIEQAQLIPQDRPQRIPAQTLVARWRKEIHRLEDRPFLVRAKKLAEPDTIASLRSAIVEAKKIARGRPLRVEAQTFIAQWNKEIEIIEDRPILIAARALAAEERFRDAIQTAEKIAPGRALYAEAQGEIRDWQWQIQLAIDRSILQQAKALAEQGSLTQAIRKASEIDPGRPLYGEAQAAIAEWAGERNEIETRRAAEQQQLQETLPQPQEPNRDIPE